MKLSRTGLTLTAVAALAVSAVIVWNQAQRSAGTAAAASETSSAGSRQPASTGHQGDGGGKPAKTSGRTKPAAPIKLARTTPVDSVTASASVAYLRKQYDVSAAEALRRLNLQLRAEQLDTQLRASLPDAYAGMWLDQAHGGVLRVETTDVASMTTALSTIPDAAHITIARVDRTLQQLDAIAATVSAKVGSSAQVAVDVKTNQVAVYQVAGAASAGAIADTAESFDTAENTVASPDPKVAAVTAANDGTVLRQLVIGAVRTDATASSRVGCDSVKCPPLTTPPLGTKHQLLRAGSRLVIKRTSANTDSDNESTTYGECTLGFVVYDPSLNKYYALTAGHCLAGPDKLGINHAYDNNLREIGTEVPEYLHGSDIGNSTYPTDYGLMAISTPSYWFDPLPRNLIYVHCTSVQATGCHNGDIPVTGVRSYSTNAGIGEVVCATGSGDNDKYGYRSSLLDPGTRCGEITDTNGGFLTNICSRKGDSGGPLFSEVTGAAYGILNDGSPGTDTCESTEWSQYSAVSSIMAAINAQDTSNGGPGQLRVATNSG